MQNQDRFSKFKLNRVKFFYLFGIFIYVLAIGYISEATASDRNTVPCEVRLEFTRDEAGGQLVRYIFFLQVKNRTPQPVKAVSVLWLSKNGEILGNSDADCKAENEPIEVGHTGQCSRTVQTISNRLIESFGQSIWTDIVNSELKTFKRIKSCKIVGYRHKFG